MALHASIVLSTQFKAKLLKAIEVNYILVLKVDIIAFRLDLVGWSPDMFSVMPIQWGPESN